MSTRRTPWRLALALALAASAAPVHAEPAAAKAAAEALFEQGTTLVAEGELARACRKFEASQKLEPALGTMLRLADCLDRSGKTASAWALFREAAQIARNRGEAEREQIASARSVDLERRLSLVELRGSAKSPASLLVRLNGTVIPEASWNSPLPVDPGTANLELTAPGHRTRTMRIAITPGPSEHVVDLPALEPVPVVRRAPRRKPAVEGGDEGGVESSSTYRTLAVIAGSAGVLGLGAGAVLGLRAGRLESESRAQCQQDDPNLCNENGVERRELALRFADAATVSAAIGGALVVTGVMLFVLAPGDERRPPSRLEVSAAPGGASVRLKGEF